MNEDYLIRITLAIYQTSEWWPESNLLKFKTRNLANEILTDFILVFYKNPSFDVQPRLLKKIQDIQQALVQARTQKLIDRKEFLLFQKEYIKIKEEAKSLVSTKKPEKEIKKQERFIQKPSLKTQLNPRQEKILKILKQREKAQVWQIQESFPSISKRTLRRDLEDLLKRELVKRSGEWNRVFYVLPLGR